MQILIPKHRNQDDALGVGADNRMKNPEQKPKNSLPSPTGEGTENYSQLQRITG